MTSTSIAFRVFTLSHAARSGIEWSKDSTSNCITEGAIKLSSTRFYVGYVNNNLIVDAVQISSNPYLIRFNYKP